MERILAKIEKLAISHDKISPEVIKKNNIKIGLRNADGTGVIVGITTKGSVKGYDKIPAEDGTLKVKPAEGILYYCGYDVLKLVTGIKSENRFGFAEVAYLLLTGELPGRKDLKEFSGVLARRRGLKTYERGILMDDIENANQMHALHSVVSHLSLADKTADSTDIKDVSRQCIRIISKMPTIIAYNYHAIKFLKGGDLNLIKPDPTMGTAENFLYMLKGKRPTEFEAHLFDLALMLHMEHGGGNNSTFTVRTVSSSGANTYMAICSGIASLSGHLHGGANEAVMKMMKELKNSVRDLTDEDEIRKFLKKILNKKIGDRTGKIFGMGHAVYTLSDPRALLLKEKAKEYAEIKGQADEYELFERVEKVAKKIFKEEKRRIISPNVDFYSGFVYKLLGIPTELFTPIFAMSRVVGWSAHRIEQLLQDKIIRPGYLSTRLKESEYIPLNKRK